MIGNRVDIRDREDERWGRVCGDHGGRQAVGVYAARRSRLQIAAQDRQGASADEENFAQNGCGVTNYRYRVFCVK